MLSKVMTSRFLLWFRRKPKWMLILMFIVLGYVGCSIKEKIEMSGKKSMVFLVPESFFGQVVLVFNQPNGVTPETKGERQYLMIPPNGLLLINADNVTKIDAEYGSDLVFLSIDRLGNKTYMPVISNGWLKHTNRPPRKGSSYYNATDWYRAYLNEKGEWIEYKSSSDDSDEPVYYPEEIRNKRLIQNVDDCRDRLFKPSDEIELDKDGFVKTEQGVAPCLELVIAKPYEDDSWPDWMYLRGKYQPDEPINPPVRDENDILYGSTGGRGKEFESFDELLIDMKERYKHKKAYFKLKDNAADTQSSLMINRPTAKVGGLCPATVFWFCKDVTTEQGIYLRKGDLMPGQSYSPMQQAAMEWLLIKRIDEA